jgi:hypothetical protein
MEFKINVGEGLNKKFSRNLLLVKNTNNGGEHQQRRGNTNNGGTSAASFTSQVTTGCPKCKESYFRSGT